MLTDPLYKIPVAGEPDFLGGTDPTGTREKSAVIVGTMDETQKRLTLAERKWNECRLRNLRNGYHEKRAAEPRCRRPVPERGLR